MLKTGWKKATGWQDTKFLSCLYNIRLVYDVLLRLTCRIRNIKNTLPQIIYYVLASTYLYIMTVYIIILRYENTCSRCNSDICHSSIISVLVPWYRYYNVRIYLITFKFELWKKIAGDFQGYLMAAIYLCIFSSIIFCLICYHVATRTFCHLPLRCS